jgi:hypothetical protein
MLTVFLSLHGAIFIDWLQPGEKFNSGYFWEEYSSRFPGCCTAGTVQVLQDRRCILTMPHLIAQPSPKNVSRVANSDALRTLHIALISVPVASFYSVI